MAPGSIQFKLTNVIDLGQNDAKGCYQNWRIGPEKKHLSSPIASINGLSLLFIFRRSVKPGEKPQNWQVELFAKANEHFLFETSCLLSVCQ